MPIFFAKVSIIATMKHPFTLPQDHQTPLKTDYKSITDPFILDFFEYGVIMTPYQFWYIFR
ncbi:MAG: hypothetical protein COA80_02315 [Leeuwenhoekiella sp.]|nr:MAG: hypothetical protein COA80_02315 [Leeuwenhoekiella sp.]